MTILTKFGYAALDLSQFEKMQPSILETMFIKHKEVDLASINSKEQADAAAAAI